MPVKGNPDNLFIGRACQPFKNIQETLTKTAEDKYDFFVIPLAAPGGQGRGADFVPSVDSELVLDSKTWSSSVVVTVSEGLQPDLAVEQAEAEVKRAALETELRWAAHLGVRGILLPTPVCDQCCSYARALHELLLAGIADGEGMSLSMRVSAGGSGWLAWNRVRTFCEQHVKLQVALEFSTDLPETDRELYRWLGEPVNFVIVPTALFKKNKQGFPVLPKRHKGLLLRLFGHRVRVILVVPDGAADSDTNLRLQYVARLFQSRPPPSQVDHFGRSHADALQAPLQPLKDNLDTETYEMFETDPVKYMQYEEAVFLFLKDKLALSRPPPFTIMVVGAGRGPLVSASLRAAFRAEVAIIVWAVEKNPNAVHALRHRKRQDECWECVEVVSEDMRVWQAPRKADVIVSELLGSFGDNELSPECLDGAQRFLAEDGASIPQSYVSSLTPVSTTKLWEELRSHEKSEDFEMAYVVNFHQACYPTGSVKNCFKFCHPNWTLESNDRFTELTFESEMDSLVHGFAGFFECDLYRGVRISIHPDTRSEGMFSWFPIYFPLREPVLLRKGQTIRSHWWRRHNASKVWYEWALSEPAATPIHNPGGRSWSIGL